MSEQSVSYLWFVIHCSQVLVVTKAVGDPECYLFAVTRQLHIGLRRIGLVYRKVLASRFSWRRWRAFRHRDRQTSTAIQSAIPVEHATESEVVDEAT